MLGSVLAKSLRDQRAATGGWSLAIAILIVAVIALWPAFASAMSELARFMTTLPEPIRALMGSGDISTARGFLSVELFAYILPVLVAVLSIGKGAATIAGEEERGQLELLLVRPLPRRSIAWQKALALLAVVTLVATAGCVVAIVGVLVADMDVAAGEIARAMLGLGLFGWFFGSLAFGIGAATGRKIVAIAIAAAVAFAAYMAATFAPLIPALHWLADVSPWSWAFGDDPIADGIKAGGALGLLAGTALFIGLGIVGFDRRDVR
ncbi:MAG: ABC transporter permease subunit [Bauldia sp.]|nr:ABC transporter permease subunit [Bauldia sp.]MCW5719006.1 ABC transporter permease subunit [Bauldia sp.]